jgi:hypothetical protein
MKRRAVVVRFQFQGHGFHAAGMLQAGKQSELKLGESTGAATLGVHDDIMTAAAGWSANRQQLS